MRLQAASKPIRIRDVICCSVPGGGSVYSRVRGEVQVVAAYLNTQFLNLGVSFMAVNVTRIVTLTNLSNFPAPFSFDNLLDLVLDPTPLYSLSASPSRGSVPPKGRFVCASNVVE